VLLVSIQIAAFSPTNTYLGAEVLKRETLNGVDAELGAGLDGSETTRDYNSRYQAPSQNPYRFRLFATVLCLGLSRI